MQGNWFNQYWMSTMEKRELLLIMINIFFYVTDGHFWAHTFYFFGVL